MSARLPVTSNLMMPVAQRRPKLAVAKPNKRRWAISRPTGAATGVVVFLFLFSQPACRTFIANDRPIPGVLQGRNPLSGDVIIRRKNSADFWRALDYRDPFNSGRRSGQWLAVWPPKSNTSFTTATLHSGIRAADAPFWMLDERHPACFGYPLKDETRDVRLAT